MNACEENNNRNNKKKNQEVIMKTKIKSVNVSQASKENYEKTRKCKSVCCKYSSIGKVFRIDEKQKVITYNVLNNSD